MAQQAPKAAPTLDRAVLILGPEPQHEFFDFAGCPGPPYPMVATAVVLLGDELSVPSAAALTVSGYGTTGDIELQIATPAGTVLAAAQTSGDEYSSGGPSVFGIFLTVAVRFALHASMAMPIVHHRRRETFDQHLPHLGPCRI